MYTAAILYVAVRQPGDVYQGSGVVRERNRYIWFSDTCCCVRDQTLSDREKYHFLCADDC